MHQVSTYLATEAKIDTILRRLEALELKGHTQVNQLSTSTCNRCNATDHIMEECPFLMNPIRNEVAQVNDAYYKSINDPYAPTYNPGWKNHPNFFLS